MKEIIYRDIDPNFIFHPVTGKLQTVTNEKAISQALKNLLLTNQYEKLYNATYFTNITYSLFENMSPLDESFLKQKCENVIRNYEKRATVTNIDVVEDQDNHSLTVSVTYIPNISLQAITVDVMLERTR